MTFMIRLWDPGKSKGTEWAFLATVDPETLTVRSTLVAARTRPRLARGGWGVGRVRHPQRLPAAIRRRFRILVLAECRRRGVC